MKCFKWIAKYTWLSVHIPELTACVGNTVQICDFPNIATDLEPYVDDYPKKLLQYPFNIPFLNVCNECGRQIYNFVGSVLTFCFN